MLSLSLKMFRRNRLPLFMAILLTAATILLSISSCLFYSVRETENSVTDMFHTVPLYTLQNFSTASEMTNDSGETYGITFKQDTALYEKLVHAFSVSEFLSQDERRTYTGYSSDIQPMRSRPKLIKTAFNEYYDFSDEGGLNWDRQFKMVVLECTLLEKMSVSTEKPTYVYLFSIDRPLAQTNYLSPLENLDIQKLYVTFWNEEDNPTGLNAGDRCLLYGTGEIMDGVWCFDAENIYEVFADGTKISQQEIASMSQEERNVFYESKLSFLFMQLWSEYPDSPTKNAFVKISGNEELDISTLEAFIQSSKLTWEEGQRWYYVIKNCQEGVNSLSVITTKNSRTIVTFNSKATQIIAGRHILPRDTEPVCIISGELAQENGLSVGDTLSLRLHRADVERNEIDPISGGMLWYLRTDCENMQDFPEINYHIVGIYQSMGWNENEYSNYFSPNTVFVTAASTPIIEISPELIAFREGRRKWYTEEELAEEALRNTPQILWGYYLTESDQAQAFMDSLPEEVRKSVQLLDEGYEHIQPQLEALREQMKGIVLLTLGAWVLVAALFIFLCLFRGQSAMGTLRSLGAGIGYTFRQWLLLCLCLWLVSAGVGGVLSGVLYDKIEQKVFEAASYGDAYNQAFSDLGSAAEQGYNPYEGIQGHSGESAETVYRQVKDTLHIGRVLPLTILAQGGVFLMLCAVTLACLTRRKVPKLLRSV